MQISPDLMRMAPTFLSHLTAYEIGGGDPPSLIPVPAAVWLFGSGLLGMIGIARRRRSWRDLRFIRRYKNGHRAVAVFFAHKSVPWQHSRGIAGREG